MNAVLIEYSTSTQRGLFSSADLRDYALLTLIKQFAHVVASMPLKASLGQYWVRD